MARLVIPSGSLSDTVSVSISVDEPGTGDLALAAEDPDLYFALTDWVADRSPNAHPSFAVPMVITGAEPVGMGIRLEPSGTLFAQSAELTVPIPEGSSEDVFFALLHDDTGWEVLDATPVGDGIVVEIPHFSGVSIWRTLGNMLSNPVLSIEEGGLEQALETLNAGPIDRIESELTGVACRTDLTFTTASMPPLIDVGWYLGYESQRIGTYDLAVKDALVDTVRARFDEESRGPVGGTPMTIESLLQAAMDVSGGDVFQALVLTHDVLRDNRDSISVQNVMEPLRGDGGDERGARYHLLGSAVFAFAEAWAKDHDAQPWYLPSADMAVRMEEGWVSGDLADDTVEFAVDLRGAQLGRALYGMYRAANGLGDDIDDEYYRVWCGVEPPAEPLPEVLAPRGEGEWAIYRIRERSETSAPACGTSDEDDIDVTVRHLESWHIATVDWFDKEVVEIEEVRPMLGTWTFSACQYHRRTDFEVNALATGVDEAWAMARYGQLVAQLSARGWEEQYSSFFPNFYLRFPDDHGSVTRMNMGQIRAESTG
jgi:hypothetical protein